MARPAVGEDAECPDLAGPQGGYHSQAASASVAVAANAWDISVIAVRNIQSAVDSFAFAQGEAAMNKVQGIKATLDALGVASPALTDMIDTLASAVAASTTTGIVVAAGTLMSVPYSIESIDSGIGDVVTGLSPQTGDSLPLRALFVAAGLGKVASAALPYYAAHVGSFKATMPAANGSPRIKHYRSEGKRFEQAVDDQSFTFRHGAHRREVRIRPLLDNGMPANFTVRLDVLGKDWRRRVFAQELKSTATAPLTKNQGPGFTLLAKNGGIDEATKMPLDPFTVKVVRPSDWAVANLKRAAVGPASTALTDRQRREGDEDKHRRQRVNDEKQRAQALESARQRVQPHRKKTQAKVKREEAQEQTREGAQERVDAQIKALKDAQKKAQDGAQKRADAQKKALQDAQKKALQDAQKKALQDAQKKDRGVQRPSVMPPYLSTRPVKPGGGNGSRALGGLKGVKAGSSGSVSPAGKPNGNGGRTAGGLKGVKAGSSGSVSPAGKLSGGGSRTSGGRRSPQTPRVGDVKDHPVPGVGDSYKATWKGFSPKSAGSSGARKR